MRSIPDSLIDEIRSRVDIVDVISEYVHLRRSGRSYVGLCPFHNERSPSFSVSPERQVYHCFGCGASGTVIRFVMDIEGISFVDAVLRLAERAGVALPSVLQTPHSSGTSSRTQRMREAHELAAKLYSYILMNTPAGVQALTYLEGRGFSRQTIAEFRLGYAPDAERTVVSFLERRGFSADLLVDAGIAVAVGSRVVDRFRGRVMIPIEDARGQVIAFAGRTLSPDGKPKYLNSPDTPVFRKGQVLFNQYRARKYIRETGTAVLLEGYMDVLAAWQAGVRNAIATMGTAFSVEQAASVKRIAERIVIAYDGDDAGLSAAEKCIDVAQDAGLIPKILWVPEGMDPDEWVKGEGGAAFSRVVETGTLTPVQFFVRRLRTRYDTSQPAAQVEYIRKVLELLAERASPVEMEAEIRALAQEFQVPAEALKAELRTISRETQRRPRYAPVQQGSAPVRTKLTKGYVEAGNRILQWMMVDRAVCEELEDRGVDELGTPEQTALLARLYLYWAEHPNGSAADFLDRMDDESLRGMASSLLVAEPEPFDPRLLADYLRSIRLHHLEVRYREAIEQWKLAAIRQDAAATEAWKQQMDELQQEMLQLKQPPATRPADAKEAGRK